MSTIENHVPLQLAIMVTPEETLADVPRSSVDAGPTLVVLIAIVTACVIALLEMHDVTNRPRSIGRKLR